MNDHIMVSLYRIPVKSTRLIIVRNIRSSYLGTEFPNDHLYDEFYLDYFVCLKLR